MSTSHPPPRLSLFTSSLLAGGLAGTAVDCLFFPLDSFKTRLQAKQGFWASGGFKGVYRGLGSVVVGSAPGAALFFTTYEQLKRLVPQLGVPSDPVVHMLSASGGEVAACLIRVPTEVVKQRQQTGTYGLKTSTFEAVSRVVKDGGVRELYRGFGSTVAREIPFCVIQFPLYERLKLLTSHQLGLSSPSDLPSPTAAMCGSVAGAVAAAATTPLDVAKTRIMLSRGNRSKVPGGAAAGGGVGAGGGAPRGVAQTLSLLVKEEGLGAIWKGIVPRTIWIGLGGAVFLGVYEAARKQLTGL